MGSSLKGVLIAGAVIIFVGLGYAYYVGIQQPTASPTGTDTTTDQMNNAMDSTAGSMNGTDSGMTEQNESAAVEKTENGASDTMQNNDAMVNTNVGANVSIDTSASVKTFTLSAQNYSFTPSEIRVKKGDTVKVVLSSANGFHDFVIDEFNTKTNRVLTGETAETQFVADKTGTFQFYCSVGNHRALGMVGNLIVE
ncbi:hypothetical protein COV04_01235 [Candidatus Uhrbacteria bacterium CG10_big_fil_rev_8_21_14_0_10_48_11]|uniref:EfeO-type cupredoxin-like domain-containing protein n=1 Tax=Candidatus Uhrbacteria bacterium CG10_big_fil_rev_8_21_14_0_10_48_11 TaxID=1975037 RepID=A0A2M8LFH4_9BACT|nr:MAG: hypothetical protein COV04_01235 [Candidatus Uhrbacteria bacterium CG10_big_fil_rev_8_21_14_0_10_48_11]